MALAAMEPVEMVVVFKSTVFTETAVRRESVMFAVLRLFVLIELIDASWEEIVFTFRVLGLRD